MEFLREAYMFGEALDDLQDVRVSLFDAIHFFKTRYDRFC